MQFLLAGVALVVSLSFQSGGPIEIAVCEGPSVASVEPVRIGVRAWPGPGVREARLAMWSAYVRGVRRMCFADASGSETTRRGLLEAAGVITRNQALFAPLAPREMKGERVTVEPAGAIAVHLLESPDAILIVGLNESAKTERVKIAFPPTIPEAIWQNMEAGNSVNFVMEKTGPTYMHTFAPKDVLVLAIRKRLR